MANIFDAIVNQLSKSTDPVFVEASAGCGKTEAITRAVARAEGKQLILTHTNAGVTALRSRLRRCKVPESKYRVATIASWLLKYALAYRSMSGFTNPQPTGAEWSKVYPSALKLFDYPFIKDVLQESYTGVFVDEYQDCTCQQHNLILKLCEYLSVRVLGDPLQGIFGFQNDPLIDWYSDVENKFKRLPPLEEPYRWTKEGHNRLLGEQIAGIKLGLIARETVDLSLYSQISWKPWSEQQEENSCQESQEPSMKIAGIHASKPDESLDHDTAKRLKGKYQCVEEMDCKDLLKYAKNFDSCKALLCFSGYFKQFLLMGIAENSKGLQKEVQLLIDDLSLENFFSFMPKIIDRTIETHPVYRKELFSEMKRAAQEFTTGKYKSLEDAAYAVRQRTRINGRKLETCIISRILLIKGLEFDHAIVLNADKLLNRENFYVAITRGSKKLTVLSSSPIIQFN